MQKSGEFEGQMDSSQRVSAVINFSVADENDDLDFSFPVPKSDQDIFPASPIFNHNILPIRMSKSKEEKKEKQQLLPISSLDGIPDETCHISTPVKERYKKKRAMKSLSSSVISGLKDLAVTVTGVVRPNKEIMEKEKSKIKLKKSTSANKIKGKTSLPKRKDYLVRRPESKRMVMKGYREVDAPRKKRQDKATESKKSSYPPYKKTIFSICANVNVENVFHA